MSNTEKPSGESCTNSMAKKLAENMQAASLIMGRVPGARLEQSDRCWSFTTPVKHPLFNGILRLRLEEAEFRQQLKQATNVFRENSAPFFLYELPGDEPANIASHLRGEQWMQVMNVPGMAMSLGGQHAVHPALGPDVTIRIVSDLQDLEAWSALWAQVFELSEEGRIAYQAALFETGLGPQAPMVCYLLLDNKNAVACSSCFYLDGTCGIYNLGTHEQYRRRGLGEILIHRCLGDAVQRGADAAITQTMPMSTALFRKIGFDECCELRVWAPAAK